MKEVIDQARRFLKETQKNKPFSVSDYYHVERVLNTAIDLAKKEGANVFIVSLAALLHDLYSGHETNEAIVMDFLKTQPIGEDIIEEVLYIIENIALNRQQNDIEHDTVEGMVVQDAITLDGMGAIGIARVFTHGGKINRIIYDGTVETNNSMKYFYEKLLKLKDELYTDSAKEVAQNRHDFMEYFLQQFYYEWNL